MNKRPLKITFGVLVIFGLVCSIIAWFELNSFHFERSKVASAGVLDLTSASSTPNEIVPLSGEWTFYPHQLLTPKELAATPNKNSANFISVPKI